MTYTNSFLDGYNPRNSELHFIIKINFTIGTFDGVHMGHQKIINALVKDAKEKKLQANLLTFFPHPRMILKSERTIKLIDTIQEKEIVLKKLGIDNLIIHPFSLEFSKLSAVEYVRDILVKKLKISTLYTGSNHHFGKIKKQVLMI